MDGYTLRRVASNYSITSYIFIFLYFSMNRDYFVAIIIVDILSVKLIEVALTCNTRTYCLVCKNRITCLLKEQYIFK